MHWYEYNQPWYWTKKTHELTVALQYRERQGSIDTQIELKTAFTHFAFYEYMAALRNAAMEAPLRR
jgi:hypothetical protein